MKAPFMPPSASATCSAVRSSNPRRARPGAAEANTRRARWMAKPAPPGRRLGQLGPALAAGGATTAEPRGSAPGERAPCGRRAAPARARGGEPPPRRRPRRPAPVPLSHARHPTRGPSGRQSPRSGGYQPRYRVSALDEGVDALVGVVGRHVELLGLGLFSEGGGPVASSDRLSRALVRPIDRWGPRPAGRPTRRPPSVELVGGHDPVHRPEALGLGGREVVAEEHHLLGPRQADEPGSSQEPPPSGTRPAADEHLDEPGLLGGQDQVTGQGQVGADAGGGAVDGADHRLLAVEHGGDHALGASWIIRRRRR